MWYNYLAIRFVKVCLSLVFLQAASFAEIRPLVWNVPAQNPHFIGREDILSLVSQAIKVAPNKTVVLSGPQGFGKTQIAKGFVYKNFADYDVVWWFRANQYLKPQFARFAQAMAYHLNLDKSLSVEQVSHDQLFRVVKEVLRRTPLKCLVIFDDAQTYPAIEDYILFSHDKNIHTLITTKNGNFSSDTVQIRPFNRSNSLAYIDLFLSQESLASKNQLAHRLDDCPAALALSIEYIKSYPGMTIDKYLLKHGQQKLSLPTGSERKLGSTMDDYETDLTAAITMNMKELQEASEEAFQVLGLLSLLHRDEIPVSFLESWAVENNIKADILTLISLIKQYSLIEVTKAAENKGAHITMQELIQTAIASQIPLAVKQKLIDQAAVLLKRSFTDQSDKNVEAILKDNNPLLNVIKISREADAISYHNPDVTQLRIRSLDVLVGMIRDFPTAEEIINHLEKDLKNKVPMSKEDEVLYYANMALYSAIRSPDYDKALTFGLKALQLAEAVGDLYNEHLRILSNLSQHSSLVGLSEEAARYISHGESVFKNASSDPYKALFILAKNIALIDQGQFQQTIDQVRACQDLLDRQTFYPSMRYFILNQLAEALLKQGDREEAKKILAQSEKYGRDVHGDNDQTMFFGRLYVLQGIALGLDPANYEKAKSLIEKGCAILDACFQGQDKHRSQAFAHLQLAKLYHQQQHLVEAKAEYLKSHAIYEKILKGKKIDDISDLYTRLAILGADLRDEDLTHTYLKKHIEIFGLDHPRIKEMMLYLDKKGLVVVV